MAGVRDVLVFDMDGVLVDVRASYRETIRATVRHLTGSDVSHDRIQQYKNSGGWNNDWALSQRICADYGIEVPYDTVVRVFQEYFFGKNNDGLVMQERWMPQNGLLERLSETYDLAIFTGRLRAEANFTLMRFVPNLEWAHIIGDDDVPRSKPAPDGLLMIAEEHPGATLTYLGDTVDDARSGREAGVRFVGVAHRPDLAELLRADGASAIIEDINQVEEVLSCARQA